MVSVWVTNASGGPYVCLIDGNWVHSIECATLSRRGSRLLATIQDQDSANDYCVRSRASMNREWVAVLQRLSSPVVHTFALDSTGSLAEARTFAVASFQSGGVVCWSCSGSSLAIGLDDVLQITGPAGDRPVNYNAPGAIKSIVSVELDGAAVFCVLSMREPEKDALQIIGRDGRLLSSMDIQTTDHLTTSLGVLYAVRLFNATRVTLSSEGAATLKVVYQPDQRRFSLSSEIVVIFGRPAEIRSTPTFGTSVMHATKLDMLVIPSETGAPKIKVFAVPIRRS